MENELQKLKQPSYMIDDPVSRAKRWITEQEERQQLEQTLRIQEPLVSFAESCMASEKSCLSERLQNLHQNKALLLVRGSCFRNYEIGR